LCLDRLAQERGREISLSCIDTPRLSCLPCIAIPPFELGHIPLHPTHDSCMVHRQSVLRNVVL
jgi:hypothetical protein